MARSSSAIRPPIDELSIWDPYSSRVLRHPKKPQSSSSQKIKKITDNDQTHDPYRPNLRIPTVWRRFVFQVMKPRDFVTYCSIIAHSNNYGCAFITYDKLTTYSGLTDSRLIRASVNKLKNLGFILTNEPEIKSGAIVFQRPSIHHTMSILLSDKIINSWLFFGKRDAADVKLTDKKAVAAYVAALTSLFGERFAKDYIKTCASAEFTETRRVEVLIERFRKDEQRYRSALANLRDAEQSKKLSDASESLKRLVLGSPNVSDPKGLPTTKVSRAS